MKIDSWTRSESTSVLAAGIAPIVVVCACSAVVSAYTESSIKDATFLSLALLAPAYASPFFFVLPALWLLRRTRRESLWTFSAATGLSVVLPWFVLYVAFFVGPDMGTFEYGNAPLLVLSLLLIPGMCAAGVAAVIHALFRPTENGA